MKREAAGSLTTKGGSACPVCGRSELRPTMDLGDYQLFACPGCRCWSSDAAYRGASTSFEPRAYFQHDRADLPRWKRVLALLSNTEPATLRVLDVGCGTGAFLEFVQETIPTSELTGIELDPERAARARERLPSATILAADAQEGLHSLSGPFDFITLWDVFEHLPAPAEVLRELSCLLAPGGRIYLQTIHEESLLPRLGRAAYHISRGRIRYPARRTHEAHHLVFFSQPGLERLAEFAGLEIEHRWFDRLARCRMDGPPLLTLTTSVLLALENWLGNGLFVNLLLGPSPNRSRALGHE